MQMKEPRKLPSSLKYYRQSYFNRLEGSLVEIKTTARIDLLKNAVYVVKDGKLQEVAKPESGHGKQIISWQGDKPYYAKLETDIRFLLTFAPLYGKNRDPVFTKGAKGIRRELY